MSNFPKQIFVTMIEGDDEYDEKDELIIEEKDDVAINNEEGVEVAVYQLVKIGKVVKTSKIVYEEK